MTSATPTIEPLVIKGLTLIPEAGAHSRGQGKQQKACIMEIVSWLHDGTLNDQPSCSSRVVTAFCRTFWDRSPRTWAGLLERKERIAGSATTPDVDRARGYRAADWAVRRFAPRWLRWLELEDDAKALEALAPVTDEASAIAARKAAAGIREKVDKRYYVALDRIRKAAGGAWAAWAAEAAGAAWAAGATWAAGAAWAAEAAEIDWSKVKGKTYSEQKDYFQQLIRPHIEKALGAEIEASVADGLALLDAMLELKAEDVAA